MYATYGEGTRLGNERLQVQIPFQTIAFSLLRTRFLSLRVLGSVPSPSHEPKKKREREGERERERERERDRQTDRQRDRETERENPGLVDYGHLHGRKKCNWTLKFI